MGLILKLLPFIFKLFRGLFKLALSRIGFIISIATGASVVLSTIWGHLSTFQATLQEVAENVQSINSLIADFCMGNSYVQLIGYALSLDFITGQLISFFFFIAVTCTTLLCGLVASLLFVLLPIFADYVVDAIRREQLKSFEG